MEKRYIIKKVIKASDNNENFKGEIHTYYYGKEDKIIAAQGTTCVDNDLTDYYIKEYGYKRIYDAKRNWSYKNPNVDEPHWNTVSLEIVEKWVD